MLFVLVPFPLLAWFHFLLCVFVTLCGVDASRCELFIPVCVSSVFASLLC